MKNIISRILMEAQKEMSYIALSLMPRLHMQVSQPGTERKASIKVFSCCQARAVFCL